MSFSLDLQHTMGAFTLDAQLEARPGLTALFGPSGVGKSTLINALSGLIHPQHGTIRLNDRTLFDSTTATFIPAHKRRIGVVFQDGRLFPHLSVLQNLRIGTRANTRQSETTLIELLGIGPLLKRAPLTLSGGETQRVALARALIRDPDLLLMDEPLAALDAPRKEEILPYLERIKSETRRPILYVSHALDEIARLADSLALMQDGRIVHHDTVFDVLSDPAAIPFVGVHEAGSVLRATCIGPTGTGLLKYQISGGTLELPGTGAKSGEAARIRIRARDIILATQSPEGLSARNILQTQIAKIDIGRGPGAAIVLTCGEDTLIARITQSSVSEMNLQIGQTVYAIVKATSAPKSAITN